jgi:hypothetical protein
MSYEAQEATSVPETGRRYHTNESADLRENVEV